MKIKICYFFITAFLFLNTGVFANPAVAPIPNTDVRFKPALTVSSSEITSAGLLSFIAPYAMGWTITNNFDGTYNYDYSMSTIAGAVTSNFFIQSTSGVVSSDLIDVEVNGLPIIPLETFVTDVVVDTVPGILFSRTFLFVPTSIFNLSFDVAAVPEWGSFRNGTFLGLEHVENLNFGGDPSLFADFDGFAPVIGVATPEPSTYLLMSSLIGVIGVGLLHNKRKKQSC